MSSGEPGKAGELGACVLNGWGAGWSGKNKVCREQMRQECPTPSMVTLQMIPPVFKKLEKSQYEWCHWISYEAFLFWLPEGQSRQTCEEAADSLVP